MTLLNWLTLFLAASLAGITILVVVLAHRNQTRWMRIFSEKQGVPAIIMDSKPEHKEPVRKIDNRARMSVPIPGMQMFKPQTDKKQ